MKIRTVMAGLSLALCCACVADGVLDAQHITSDRLYIAGLPGMSPQLIPPPPASPAKVESLRPPSGPVVLTVLICDAVAAPANVGLCKLLMDMVAANSPAIDKYLLDNWIRVTDSLGKVIFDPAKTPPRPSPSGSEQ